MSSNRARFERLANTDAVRQDLRSHSIRATIVSATTSLFDFALRFGSTAIFARLILPEHFGLVMMVTAVTAVADQLKDFGLSTATVQKKDITHEQVSNLFWINVAAGLSLGLLVCLLSPLIAAYYREPRLVSVACVFSLNFLLGGLMVQHQALLTRQLKFKQTSAVRLTATALSTAFSIYLAFSGYGYWALVWKEILRGVILTVGMWMYMPWIPSLPARNTGLRPLLAFGSSITGANIVASAASGADRFFLGRLWGPEPVALFRQAYQLLLVPMDQLISPIYQVTQPGLGLLLGDHARYRRFYLKVVLLVCLVTMPFSAFVALYSAEITHLLLGPRWENCAQLIAILSLSAFIKQPVDSSVIVLITHQRGRDLLFLSLFQTGVFALFMMVGSRWGAVGAALADVAMTYALIWPKLAFALKGTPVTLGMFFSAMARPLAASVLMAGVVWGAKTWLGLHSTLYALMLGAGIAAITFLAFWLMMPGGLAEITHLVGDVRLAMRKKMGGGNTPASATS